MPKEFNRSDRVADALQRSLANTIRTEIQDPRVGMVNINSVSVTRDLAHAKVYVTFVGSENDAESETAVSVLNNASGYLRNLISRDLTTRITPRLQFVYDKSSILGQELSSLIDRAVAEDRARHEDEPGNGED